MKLIYKTISQLIEENAQNFADKDAFVFCEHGTRYSWFDLKTKVDKVAKGFLANDIKQGEHIAIWATNVPEWVITQFAAAKIGAILITINPEWKLKELNYALKQSDTSSIVMIPGFTKKSGNKVYSYNYVEMIKELCPNMLLNHGCEDNLPTLKHKFIISQNHEAGFILWSKLLSDGRLLSDQDLKSKSDSVQASDLAMIQYTSGTTGFPKGAMLSQMNIINNAKAAISYMNLSHKDKICGPVPFYHCFGSILVNMICLVSGATAIIPSSVFNPAETLKAIESEKCTALHGVPTMFIAELEDLNFKEYDLSSLRTGIIAGAPVEKELFKAITHKMGANEMTIAYGLTEASPVTHQTCIQDPENMRYSTVGKPIKGTYAKIVDPLRLQEADIGEVGEIWVKGFHVMKGYYKKEQETAEAIIDGWLRTGDLAKKEENGYYKIVGRLKNMIIVGGHNVYPAEVEQGLYSMLKNNVELLQVVGLPNSKLQEVVGLAIKFKKGREMTLNEIRKICLDKMEWPKIPRYLMSLQDFSDVMTVTGKIQKFKLKNMMIKKFGLQINDGLEYKKST